MQDKDWWHEVCTVTLEWFDLRTEALLAEKHAIAIERPRYNGVAGHQSPGHGVTPNRVIRMRQEWDEWLRLPASTSAPR